MSALLQVRGLCVHFRTRQGVVRAVEDLSFDIAPGETMALVGESGSGKSTVAAALMRIVPSPPGEIAAGEAIFEGEDLLKLPEARMRDIRGSRIAMIFQDPMMALNPVHTIGAQIAEALVVHGRMDRRAALARAVELLELVRAAAPGRRVHQYPHNLSGGMRQRVMIAMALACEPRLLVADEPTTALDVTIQAQVLELIGRLTTETGTSLILITHDLGVVAGMTDRINVMYAGFIVETATTPDLFERPSHPYTVGLLHSMPRVDEREGEPLIPIEGRPPDMRHAPTGCPFAPRCAWRLDVCWTDNPPLEPVVPGTAVVLTGERATHRIACHNPPTVEEAVHGHPSRPGHRPAPPPAGQVDELASYAAIADGSVTAEHLQVPPDAHDVAHPTQPRHERAHHHHGESDDHPEDGA